MKRARSHDDFSLVVSRTYYGNTYKSYLSSIVGIWAGPGKPRRPPKAHELRATGLANVATSAAAAAVLSDNASGPKGRADRGILFQDALAAFMAAEKHCPGMACADNSDPIPCDGKVYERTFGPGIPTWPDEQTVRDHLDPADRKLYMRFGPSGKRKQERSKQKRRIFARPGWSIGTSMGGGVSNVTQTGDTASFPVNSGRKSVAAALKVAVSQGSGGLAQAIAYWMASIYCKQYTGWMKCSAIPEIVSQDGTSQGDNEDWYVSHFLFDDAGLKGHVSVCIKARFRCIGKKILPVIYPDDYGTEHIDNGSSSSRCGCASCACGEADRTTSFAVAWLDRAAAQATSTFWKAASVYHSLGTMSGNFVKPARASIAAMAKFP